MKFTYKKYFLTRELNKFRNSIEIISEEKMDLGSIVVFNCEDNKILDEIFCED